MQKGARGRTIGNFSRLARRTGTGSAVKKCRSARHSTHSRRRCSTVYADRHGSRGGESEAAVEHAWLQGPGCMHSRFSRRSWCCRSSGVANLVLNQVVRSPSTANRERFCGRWMTGSNDVLVKAYTRYTRLHMAACLRDRLLYRPRALPAQKSSSPRRWWALRSH